LLLWKEAVSLYKQYSVSICLFSTNGEADAVGSSASHLLYFSCSGAGAVFWCGAVVPAFYLGIAFLPPTMLPATMPAIPFWRFVCLGWSGGVLDFVGLLLPTFCSASVSSIYLPNYDFLGAVFCDFLLYMSTFCVHFCLPVTTVSGRLLRLFLCCHRCLLGAFW
jgi:hypothetical protein